MSLVIETGSGTNPEANAYVDPTSDWAVSYALAWLYKAEWTAADAATKEAAIISATRTLDASYQWYGNLVHDGSQPLGWPRYVARTTIPSNAVPVPIKAATMEMALALLQRNRTSDTGSGSQSLKGLSLGDGALKLDFGSDPTKTPVLSIIPSFIRGILRDYGDAAGGAMVNVQRR